MKKVDLKQHLYMIVLMALLAFSILAIIVNFITRLPLSVNIKWLLLFCVTLINIFYVNNKPYSSFITFIFLLFIALVFMPYGFINGGGFNSDFIAYSFFALIVVTYILDGAYQKILVATIITAFIGLHLFAKMYPELIPVYNFESRFYDRLIQVPILLFFNYIILRHFANAYNQTNQKLTHYANYDMLTGLLNRWALSDSLQKRLSLTDFKGYLVFMDIDNFKLVNDKKGHMVGDDVLKQLGNILNKYFDNGQNLVSRWGGDEFVVIFFGDVEQLDLTVEKATKEFLIYINSIEPLVDISIGFTSLESCKSVDDIFSISDQLMYKQKCSKKKSELHS